MKMWSLYNKAEKLRVDDLTLEQVKIVLLGISSRQMSDWYTCQEGQLNWEQLSAMEEITAKSAPPRKVIEEFESQKTDATVHIDLSDIQERRTARRYARRLHFECVIDHQKFTCETVDVSMNGLSLSRSLPQWVPKHFKAELALNNHTAKINCERVSAKKLKLTGTDNWDLIRQWIVNF